MKKIIAISIVSSMLLLAVSMSGCGGQEGAVTSEGQTQSEKSQDNSALLEYVPDMSVKGREETIASVKQLDDDIIYTMSYKEDYDLDHIMEAEIRDSATLVQKLADDYFDGEPIFGGNLDRYSCSAFLTKTPDGNYIAGRNFDHMDTEVLILHTEPKGGYASDSTVALDMLGVGGENSIKADSEIGKYCMIVSPYLCMDGMNEKGLNVSILNLDDTEEIHQDNGKPDLIVTVAVRLLLDRAASVDEAVDMLKQYDIQTVEGTVQHLFISDKTGKSVVVEWSDKETMVTDSIACTNFQLSELKGKYSGKCERFDAITDWMKNNPENDEEDAMSLLETVTMYPDTNPYGMGTQWSCVYDLENFTEKIVVCRKFNTVHSITNDNFTEKAE